MVQKIRFLKLCKVKQKIKFPESNRRKQIHGPHIEYVKVNKKPVFTI